MVIKVSDFEKHAVRFTVVETSFYPSSRSGPRSFHDTAQNDGYGCEPTTACAVKSSPDFDGVFGACCDLTDGFEPCCFEHLGGLGCEPTHDCLVDPDFPTDASGLGCEPSCTVGPELSKGDVPQ